VLALVFISLLLCVCLPLLIRYKKPRFLYGALETLVLFIRDSIVRPGLGEDADKFAPYFCTLFFFIITLNAGGMVPGGRTATGNIAVTIGLALTTFLLINIAGVAKHGAWGYVKTYVPHGTPWWLTPVIFPLEVLGLFTKTAALAIRLFANMISGHMVLICFMALLFLIAQINAAAGWVTVAPVLGLSLFTNILELLVIAIQAYVFTLLTAIFTGAVLNPH
jgi:F-type H+-transporting ATPase subunit a